jgi:hypothetical protein
MPMLYPHSLLHFRWLLVLYAIEGAVSKAVAPLNGHTCQLTQLTKTPRIANVLLRCSSWSGCFCSMAGAVR